MHGVAYCGNGEGRLYSANTDKPLCRLGCDYLIGTVALFGLAESDCHNASVDYYVGTETGFLLIIIETRFEQLLNCLRLRSAVMEVQSGSVCTGARHTRELLCVKHDSGKEQLCHLGRKRAFGQNLLKHLADQLRRA